MLANPWQWSMKARSVLSISSIPYSPVLTDSLLYATYTVAELQLVSLPLLRAPALLHSHLPAYRRLHRLRPHRARHPRAPHPLRLHPLPLPRQPIIRASDSARCRPRRAAPPAVRPARRRRCALGGERRRIRARAGRGGNGAPRRRALPAPHEADRRAREREPRDARRLARAGDGAARALDLGRGARCRHGRAKHICGPPAGEGVKASFYASSCQDADVYFLLDVSCCPILGARRLRRGLIWPLWP